MIGMKEKKNIDYGVLNNYFKKKELTIYRFPLRFHIFNLSKYFFII